MISVVVRASDDAAALARLLTALVPAAAEGLVRDVLVLGAEGASYEIAEDAGAMTASDGSLGQVLTRCRGDWIAHLPLSAVLAEGWMNVLEDFLRDAAAPARIIGKAGLGLRRRPFGWLAPRRTVLSVAAVEKDLQGLARRLGGRPLRILRAS